MRFTKITGLLCATLFAITGCTKEVEGPKGDPGPRGPAGPEGPGAKYYDFNLVFDDEAQTDTFAMPQTSMTNRATFVYVEYLDDDWVALPWTLYNPGFVPVAFWAECDEMYEQIVIHTDRADSEPGSPWAGETELFFRAVTIDMTAGRSGLDFNDYKAVQAAYGLPD